VTGDRVRVFSCLTGVQAHFLRGVLEQAGVTAEVRQEGLAFLAGAVPLDSVMVELWVPVEDAERAQAILASQQDAGEPSTCARCGEVNPPGFEVCWSCQSDLLRS
jgi:ribosomal protein L40E